MGIADHVCGVGELDYDNVEDGYILCLTCGRMFRLTQRGWVANPPVVQKPTWKKKYRR